MSKTKTAKKMSLLNAAAQALRGRKNDISAHDLYDVITSKGLWTSPKGKTPVNSLEAQMNTEIKTKGKASRFIKPEPGRFALNPDREEPAPKTGENGKAGKARKVKARKVKARKVKARKVKARKVMAVLTPAPAADEGFHAGDTAPPPAEEPPTPAAEETTSF